SAYQELLETAFGTSDAAVIAGFTVAGDRPYDPADQGTLPPWFADSPQAAAVSTLINDFVFRCGTFLTSDGVVEASGAKPVYPYPFAQPPTSATPPPPPPPPF